MKRLRLGIASTLALAAFVALVRLIAPAPAPADHELLREVYSPRFARVPPPAPAGEVLSRVRTTLQRPEGNAFLRRWVPAQAGTLCLALLVALVVGFDFDRPRHPRNIDLLAAQALGFLFFDILTFAYRLRDPFWLALLWWVFSGIVILNLLLAARAVWHVRRPLAWDWRPPLHARGLVTVALLMLLLDVTAAALRAPDDAGFFVNLGAQRLRERGRLPYGDPLLTGTPGAAYGPLLYVAHLPFQWLVDPQPVNRVSSPRPPLGQDSTYYLPAPLATKLCVIAFQVLAAASLYIAGRRFGSRETGWALVALYCGSAFVLGMGGEEYFIGGMTYISHIGPPAVTLAAFAALRRPGLAGVLLAAAAGCGFYPAFLMPAWAGHYFGRRPVESGRHARRGDLVRFLAGFIVAGAAIAAFVLLLSRPAAGRGVIGTFLWDTFGHHSDPAGYGASPFGFWGQRTGVRGWLMRPIAGGSGLASPVMLLFFAFALSCFFLARRRGEQALALLSAAIVIGSNVVKIHSTGTYVAWFYPLLLLGLFLPTTRSASERSVTIDGSACQKGPSPRPSSSAPAPPA